MKRIIVAFLSCVFTVGCALFRSKPEPYPTGVIFPVKAESRWEYDGEIIDRIEKKEDRLFFSTRGGRVFCIDPKTQKTVWRSKVSDDLVSAPVLGEKHIYVHDGLHRLFCLDVEGKRIWEKKIADGINPGMLASDGKVFLGTSEGELAALQGSDGAELWRFKVESTISSNIVGAQDLIIFGCSDHTLYFVDHAGRSAGTFVIGEIPLTSMAVDGSLLYFGTEDHSFHCLDLTRRKRKWKVRTGGRVDVPPVFDNKRIYLTSWNNVVFCMNKIRGDIHWWDMIPARSRFQLELIDNRLIATSQSETAVCFDVETGKRRGTYKAESQIMSNALWLDPFLLVSTYDEDQDITHLDLLGKEIAVTLKSAGKGASFTNEEVAFNASPVGFHKPEFSFFLRPMTIVPAGGYFYSFIGTGDREPVLESAEESKWEWYPEEAGVYEISVEVKDEKEKAETGIVVVVMDRIVEKEKETVEDEVENEKKSDDKKRGRRPPPPENTG